MNASLAGPQFGDCAKGHSPTRYARAVQGSHLLLWLATLGSLASTTSEHGSLIVGVPVQSGWVVCGDKRVISPIRGVHDDQTKVFQVRPGLIFGVTGFQRMVELVEGEVITRFSVADVVTQHLSTRPFTGTQDDLQALGNELVSALQTFLARTHTDGLPELEESDTSGFSIAVFWVEKSSPTVAMWRLRFQPVIAVDISKSRISIGGGPRSVGMGNTRVWLELERGTRKEFGKVRTDPSIQAFLSPDSDYVTTSRRDAERFARRMIAVTSEMNPLLGLVPSDVGPTVDCLQVGR